MIGSQTLSLSERTRVMGVLNVTPDSFSDGGRYVDPGRAVAHALQMLDEGADIIDVGGESTRPGAREVSVGMEIERTVPLIARIRAQAPGAVVSIDTTKAPVARAALEAGAQMVNDISGLGFDAAIADVAAEFGASLVLMHMQGTPRTMQAAPHYTDVVKEVIAFLDERATRAIEAGVSADRIIVDPGFGFGKALEHNLEILRRLDEFTALGYPVLVGTSRKSFIGAITGRPATERVHGTAATVAIAALRGASIVRVHDVAAMVDVVRVVDAAAKRT